MITEDEWHPYGSPPDQHISEIVMRLDDRDCIGFYDRPTQSYFAWSGGECRGGTVEPVMWRDVTVGRNRPARLPMFRGWMYTSLRWVEAAKRTTRDDYRLDCYSRAADAAGMAFLFLDKAKIKTLNIVVAHWAAVLQRAGRFEDAMLVCEEFFNDARMEFHYRKGLWVSFGLARRKISGHSADADSCEIFGQSRKDDA